MPRFFFHKVDGQRRIDRGGTDLEGLPEAKAHAIKVGCMWVHDEPDLLIIHQDCRVEVTDQAYKTLFTFMMFTVDNEVWRGRC